MDYNCEVNINGKPYKFESVEDDPLIFIMKVDEQHHLYRQIDCDSPTEKMTLHKYYNGVINSIPKEMVFSQDVYNGKEIVSEDFMKVLLEHVLHKL